MGGKFDVAKNLRMKLGQCSTLIFMHIVHTIRLAYTGYMVIATITILLNPPMHGGAWEASDVPLADDICSLISYIVLYVQYSSYTSCIRIESGPHLLTCSC